MQTTSHASFFGRIRSRSWYFSRKLGKLVHKSLNTRWLPVVFAFFHLGTFCPMASLSRFITKLHRFFTSTMRHSLRPSQLCRHYRLTLEWTRRTFHVLFRSETRKSMSLFDVKVDTYNFVIVDTGLNVLWKCVIFGLDSFGLVSNWLSDNASWFSCCCTIQTKSTIGFTI